MRLYSIEYSEYKDEAYSWNLEELNLININLIVGKNATGKSRVLRLINALARLITGVLTPTFIQTGHFKIVLKSDSSKKSNKVMSYELEIHNNAVKKEILTVNGDIKLERNIDTSLSRIVFEQVKGNYIDIQVPEHNLAVTARRDTKQHPFFEDLHVWATRVNYSEFTIKDQNTVTIIDKNIKPDASNLNSIQPSPHLLVKFGKENHGRNLMSPVISDMKKIGYEISDFGLMPSIGVESPIGNPNIPQLIYVKEVDIDKKLSQNEISSGMFRALLTLIQLHVIRLEKKPSCVLIDDIGEGLDFDRASKLISIIISQAEEGYSQLLLTTNDRFVMNNVPLEYWCVLEREKGKVKSYTPRNSPETFKDFEEYGFNNFDFFSKGLFSQSIKISK